MDNLLWNAPSVVKLLPNGMNNASSRTRWQIFSWAVVGIVIAVICLFLPSLYESVVEGQAPPMPVYESQSESGGLSPDVAIQNQTNVTAVGVVALVVMAYLVWTLPRRFAVCPLLVMVCLMPLGQQLVMFGLHFYLFRVLLSVGIARVIAQGEAAKMKWVLADKLFLWWILVSIVFGTMSKLTPAHFQNRLGDAFNASFCYFFIRCVIVDFEDIIVAVCTLAWSCIPVAALMLIEKATAHNLLSVFGGVSEITELREGHLRCQGAFRHPILAGVFGATQIPLFVALWYYRSRYRLLAGVGTISAIIITIAAASSGAIMSALMAVGGLALWKFRKYLRWLRWGVVVMLLCSPLVMHAPVWHLMAKADVFSGSTGWHRAYVIDVALEHLNEWWLFGTTYTAHWGPGGQVIAADPDMMDITNHYIVEGVNGGLFRLALFIVIIVVSFNGLGRALQKESATSTKGFFLWALGASMSGHCLAFLSITYFDQLIIVWYWLWAVIASLDNIQISGGRSAPAYEESIWERGPSTVMP